MSLLNNTGTKSQYSLRLLRRLVLLLTIEKIIFKLVHYFGIVSSNSLYNVLENNQIGTDLNSFCAWPVCIE